MFPHKGCVIIVKQTRVALELHLVLQNSLQISHRGVDQGEVVVGPIANKVRLVFEVQVKLQKRIGGLDDLFEMLRRAIVPFKEVVVPIRIPEPLLRVSAHQF